VTDSRSLSGVRKFLKSVRRRAASERAFEGSAATIAILAGAALALFAADRSVLFPPPLRLVAALALGAAAALLSFRRILAPIVFPKDLAATAADVERAMGSAQGFVRSAAELALLEHSRSSAPSEILLNMTVEEAARRLAPRTPADAAPKAAFFKQVAAAVTLCSVWGIVALLFPADSAAFFRRLANPFGDISYPARTRIAAFNAPGVVAAGDPFGAEIIAEGLLPAEATFAVRTAAGERKIHAAGEDGRYRLRMQSVRETFSLGARVGDAVAPWREVLVVERPAVAEIETRLTFPPYTKLDASTFAGGDVTAPGGSRASLSARLNKPVRSATVVFEDGGLIEAALDEEGRAAGFEFEVRSTISYRLSLVDEHGFEDDAQRSWQIRALGDSAPVLSLVRPSRDLSLVPTAVLPVEAEASDDYGVRLIVLSYEVEKSSGEKTAGNILLEAAEPRKTVAVAYLWDLAPLALDAGDRMLWRLEAVDNFPPEGQTTLSESRECVVVTVAEKLDELRRLNRRLQGDVAEAERIQKRAAEELRRAATGDGGGA
jgi:hypothetical protein